MRYIETKYRGQRIDNNEWVYGYFVYDDSKDRAYIYQLRAGGAYTGCVAIEVIQETVGQFTGLFDKNDNEIYKGDIVECPGWTSSGEFPAQVLQHELNKKHQSTINKVLFINGAFCVVASKEPIKGQIILLSQFNDACEVVGNAHEHHEMLAPQ